MTGAVGWAALAAAALLLAWAWRPRKTTEPATRVLLAAYALLGAWALAYGLFAAPGQEPAAFQVWKPSVLYGVLAAIMIVAPLMGWGYPVKAIVGTYFVFSNREWHWINLGFATACAILGGLNMFIVIVHTQDDWEGFKFSCMVNILAIFLLRLTFVWVDTFVRIVIAVRGRLRALWS